MNNYKTKYLKYKAKYLKLKGGGQDNFKPTDGEKEIAKNNPLYLKYMKDSLDPDPTTPKSPDTPLSPNTPDNSPEPIAPNIILPNAPEEPQIPNVSKSYTTEIAGAMVGVSLISCLLINILKT